MLTAFISMQRCKWNLHCIPVVIIENDFNFFCRLHHIEVFGLLALWRVVSGRRYNVLRGEQSQDNSYFLENGTLN